MPTRALTLAAALVAGFAVGGISACVSGGRTCTTSSDCGDGNVCLQIGTCAEPCSTAAQCASGERCSSSGGCVPASGCGADTDCSSTQVCEATGSCVDNCHLSPCAATETCEADGHCKPAAEEPADAGPDSCGGQLFQATRVQANFLIVLDHSGSMMDSVGGQPKWTSAVAAVKTLTEQHDQAIRFGLQLFAFSSSQCNPGGIDVAIGDGTANAITSALPTKADGRSTPIAGALEVAGENPGLHDADRSNNVLLVTDGMENCGGDPVAKVKTLFNAGVKTYVVGFGGDVDADMLSEMAVEGGTALAGNKQYYQADNPADLEAALAQVANGALGCDFALQDVPPDPDKIFVYVDGQLQARDTSKQSGWDYSAASNRVTLYGATCSHVTTNPNAKVNLVYGCPDVTLVEGGGDGGNPPPSDGGVQIN